MDGEILFVNSEGVAELREYRNGVFVDPYGR